MYFVSMVDFNICGLIKTETIKLLKLIYKILPCKKNSIFFTQKNAIQALHYSKYDEIYV